MNPVQWCRKNDVWYLKIDLEIPEIIIKEAQAVYDEGFFVPHRLQDGDEWWSAAIHGFVHKDEIDTSLGWRNTMNPTGHGYTEDTVKWGWTEVAEVGPNEKKAKIDGLNSGDKYRFRVKAINKLGQSTPCEMKGGDVCIKDPWGAPSAPGTPNILDWGPDFCDISFAIPESDGGAKISHYQVEIKENKMKNNKSRP